VETTTESQLPNQPNRTSLDERIRNMQVANSIIQASSSIQTQSYPTQSTSKPRVSNKSSSQHRSMQNSLPSTSQISTNERSPPTLPILQIPKKSALSFIQRFTAQHANHEKPEYRKIASIPCDPNEEKSIPIYLFKDEKRAYEAAGEQGRNQFKIGGRLVSYYPVVEKVPNKAKFNNEYQKQVWIHMLETVGTYNLYTLLGKFDQEENIIIHNVNQPIDMYLTGLKVRGQYKPSV